MSDLHTLSRALADVILEGTWTARDMAQRAFVLLGMRSPSLNRVLRKIRGQFPRAPLGDRDGSPAPFAKPVCLAKAQIT